ncbi:pyridoxamine 5'-phosphate oxidase [Polynucleobacter paneuropaeus]|uniref:Pyridoxine/pyridoxamine 5'-phosphate oxidase n=1 Tax=Polynucleobacter paneuropaeus TaxID=2527775 RepID=A0A9Q7CMA4_9BURK|nr:pyridoxamine 5'-phosphate oxidase [Polynucleobacter paneuropaeus]AWW47621.1 pyridoxamine 5'-phosphate oxidase [Polynucleobacter paneuropaeus]MBT8550421.1 pyridoxamine 5'-phosphate oxidase [Polynucleobacter paneuropaeus]MBT8556288.1 pyridoxamine 5'-phosphate oxidase [Polynucleobacter paneuropaeus]MBT8578739.1 pyridoxamine 5'-phosphate oxidase [Polynucleobacter paneuropaeus]MBT8606836.1 pyridoxamine 5'-phosphate oxidase [Polynucleobacter paneuropaeus]
MNSIAELRKNYTLGQLSETQVPANPLELFHLWFDQAIKANCPEPNSMALATADQSGNPSARIVLLKGASDKGFTFFTNYQSQKGQELANRPEAALLFHWHELERQVRIKGTVTKVDPAQSDEYFHSRPSASRIGAWASPQSAEIPSREFLEEAEKRFLSEHGDNPPRPDHWGGYCLSPTEIEFWQGRPSRLHDRIQYKLQDQTWRIARLAP